MAGAPSNESRACETGAKGLCSLPLKEILRMKRQTLTKILLCLALAGTALPFQSTQARFSGPTSSGPIAVTPDDSYVLVANPDSNSVTLIDVRSDANRKLA